MVMMVTPVVVAMYDIPATSHPEQGGNLLAVHSGNLLLTPSNLLLWYCVPAATCEQPNYPKVIHSHYSYTALFAYLVSTFLNFLLLFSGEENEISPIPANQWIRHAKCSWSIPE